MNDATFDRVTKRLTRRRSFWLLTAAGLSLHAKPAPAPVEARRRRRRCRRAGAPCTSFERCCSKACDFLVGGGTCAPCAGQFCNADFRCCGRLKCIDNFCDGCRSRATVCTSSDQCCFSDCGSSHACLSDAGGRCVHDADCAACYLRHNCTNACVGGKCSA